MTKERFAFFIFNDAGEGLEWICRRPSFNHRTSSRLSDFNRIRDAVESRARAKWKRVLT